MRAAELGITVGHLPAGPADAITDVVGVRVGHTTLIEGEVVRTGVTVVLPHGGNPGKDPLFAGCHRLNGRGELTGLEWVRESGLLSSPIGLTNTYSVGVVRDALVATELTDGLPVVGETWDGGLNDIRGMHVRTEHVDAALAEAQAAPELPVRMLADRLLTPLFDAVIDATEAAILNALLAGTTMRGYRGTVYALTAEALVEALTRLGRPPANRT